MMVPYIMDCPSLRPQEPEPGTTGPRGGRLRVVFFANTDWYLFHFRSGLMRRVAEVSGAEVLVACPQGPYVAKLQAQGYAWIPVEIQRRSLNPISDIVSAWRLAKVFRRLRPDLLHAFTLKAIVIGTLAARLSGLGRVVNAVTGMGTLFGSRSLGSLLSQRLLSLYFRFFLDRGEVRTIFQNREDLRMFEQISGIRRGLRLIPGSGVDTQLFAPSGARVAPPVVLMASRLIRDKGVRIFCEAARRVCATAPGVAFRIAGTIDPGNPSSYTQAEIASLVEAYPMVEFLGHRLDIREMLQSSAVAVLPSQAREGLPRFLIEAAASGLPLVGTDIEGIRDVVLEGRNGLLVPPGDAEALARALLSILEDDGKRSAMGEESRALALAVFDQEKVFADTQAVYGELGFPPSGGA